MSRLLTRVWFWIVAPFVLLLVGVAIWLLLPLRHPGDAGFAPADPVGFAFAKIDLDSEVAEIVLAQARDRLLGTDPGWIARTGFAMATKAFTPKSVAVWLSQNETGNLPGYLAAVSFGRGGRLLRAFGGGIVGRELLGESARKWRSYWTTVRFSGDAEDGVEPAAFAFKRDTFLVASSLNILEGALADPVRRPPPGPLADQVAQVATARGLLFFGDNQAGLLTPAVRAAEEEFAFSVMPSVDALSDVLIQGTFDEGAIVGSALFTYDDADRVAEGRSDVRYLYGVIRRLLRPRGADMEADIVVDGLSVRFDYQIPNAQVLFQMESDQEE